MKRSSIMTASTATLLLVATGASAEDIEAGKTAFKKCVACHSVDTTTNKVGPHLGDVMGRTAGTVEGFKYSKAMMDAGAAGLVWDETHLTEYLVAPKAKVPGTKMAFAGIKKPDELANLIAYLKTLPE